MKKLLVLALGAATLSLGACSRHTCPAYSTGKLQKATLASSMASQKHNN